MLRVYCFTEQPYPDAWATSSDSLRINLPNEHCDPSVAADLFHRYYDEWQLADELGFELMTNEHHQTATCLSPSITVALSILARNTKRARILALGVPLPHRSDPVRIAEEMSVIDVLSRGRLDMGFVKGVPYEFAPSNANPVGTMARFWEAHDLILKAMTTRTGPFNFEGNYFHYRNVNIWPRPYQQPHPRVWSTTSTVNNVRQFVERDITIGTVLGGFRNCKTIFQEYRRVWGELGRGETPADRLAYLGLCVVADNEAEAMRRAWKLAGYLHTSSIVSEPFRNPPGFASISDNAKFLRHGPKAVSRTLYDRKGDVVDYKTASAEQLVDLGMMFAGTPDQVYHQIAQFHQGVGGYDNLLMMMQAGHLSHRETTDSLTLFAKEMLPRLKELKTPVDVAA
jgi:alkanesulfonate monooxygenase SsuD/methylene tetrahydromethanopterin reductase-like flavin-dependent oxidoreductase (luciferase family)